MTALLITDAAPNTPEWHAAREQGIGASEIAAVVGLSPFESPFSLWHRKKGNIPGPDPSNDLFYWGHALEPVVADRFGDDHHEFDVVSIGTHRSAEREWQFANLDRALYNPAVPGQILGLLEIKTTRYSDGYGPTGSDLIPLHVRCQVTQQMDVFGVDHAWVAVLIGGSDYREYRIPFDPTDAASLRDAGAAFWASLQNDDEPPIDASFATYEAVRDLHPDIDADADAELDPALHGRYVTSKADADTATAAHRQAKAEVLAVMGNARRALVDGTPVLRRQPGRGGAVSLYAIKEKTA